MTQFEFIIKQLKSIVFDISELKSECITDNDYILLSLCQTIEMVFRFGFKHSKSIFSSERTDYWNVLEKIVNISRVNSIKIDHYYENLIELVSLSKRVKTNLGRGRYLIRFLVQNKMLHVPVNFIISYKSYFRCFYDAKNSILMDDVNAQLLESLIDEVDRKTYRIDLTNADFLDETWELPKIIDATYVPCTDLGLVLRVVSDHYLVEAVDPKGVAGEDDRVETGDIITQLFDKPLRGFPGVLKNVLSSNKFKPVQIKIVKARAENNKIFRPILELLSHNGLTDLLSEKSNVHASIYRQSLAKEQAGIYKGIKVENNDDLVPVTNLEIQSSSCGLSKDLRFRYVGQYPVGAFGTVELISVGIGQVVLQEQKSVSFRPVKFHFGELSLVITELDPLTQKPLDENVTLFNHVYPRIASCGRRSDLPRYFGYIIGDTTCCIAKSFVCLVFEAFCVKEAEAVVNNLAIGFERTHWAL